MSNTGATVEVAPPRADQATAEHLGARVARAALRWREHAPALARAEA